MLTTRMERSRAKSLPSPVRAALRFTEMCHNKEKAGEQCGVQQKSVELTKEEALTLKAGLELLRLYFRRELIWDEDPGYAKPKKDEDGNEPALVSGGAS